MKRVVIMTSLLIVMTKVVSASVEDDAAEYMKMYSDLAEGSCETCGVKCVREIANGDSRIQFEYFKVGGSLTNVRVLDAVGGMVAYGFQDGEVINALVSTNRKDGVMTSFVRKQDPKDSNGVYRIERDYVNRRAVGQERLFRKDGSRIVPEKKDKSWYQKINFDIEYPPPAGTTIQVGPYVWMALGPRWQSVLMDGEREIVRGRIDLAGMYPWVIGFCTEEYTERQQDVRSELKKFGFSLSPGGKRVEYAFKIDMRSGDMEFSEESAGYRQCNELGARAKSMWYYSHSQNAKNNLKRLNDALEPPTSDH